VIPTINVIFLPENVLLNAVLKLNWENELIVMINNVPVSNMRMM